MTFPFSVAPPPALESLPAFTRLVAGTGFATVLPDMDFETYSEAGFVWNDADQKWRQPNGNSPQNRGLGAVGAAVYSEHSTCEVLSLKYDLKDGTGQHHWKQGDAPPLKLFAYLATGGPIECHNAAFEHWIWVNVCVARMGWPPIHVRQLRCSMAKARAFALPGGLEPLSDVLNLKHKKDADGKRLLNKFSIPQNPTKKNPQRRIRLEDDPAEAQRLFTYNGRDIEAEAEASSRIPDLSSEEQEFWFCDRDINFRGVAVDTVAIENCIVIVEQAYERYNAELRAITGGQVETASQLERLKGWLAGRGVYLPSGDEEAINEALTDPGLDPISKRALQLRGLLGSASIKKLFALRNQTTRAGRVHDLFNFHAARTGRVTGEGPQPTNLPRYGPNVYQCTRCNHWSSSEQLDGNPRFWCAWCGAHNQWKSDGRGNVKPMEWNIAAAEDALTVIATRSLQCVEMFFGNALTAISGCLRGLFIAGDGHDLIASDYVAIEAVVLAALAGCEWRLEVFRTHGKIYEASASRVTGIPLEEFLRYKKETGSHRPERQTLGKHLELACGYGGWINAGKQSNIRMDEHFSDDEIKHHILSWRAASPEIPEFWGGQHRGHPWEATYRQEYYGLEGAAVQAVMWPGKEFKYRAISYFVRGDVLYCRLPSGRLLTYHKPRLSVSTRNADELALSFEGWNTNPKNGPYGWIRMFTYGGKLTENVVQAVSRDILRNAIVRLEARGYPVVLHVYDEIVVEVAKGWGSIEEVERIMMVPADWHFDWPVKASGGWRGPRYRKD